MDRRGHGRALRRGLITIAAVLAATTAPAAPARAADPPPPKLPAPTYPKTVSAEELVTMDDGVRLAATVTFPSQDGSTRAPGRFPVVLQTTPYGRDGVCGCTSPALFAQRGIVSAVVDVRGTGGSGGDLKGNYFSPREARDGAALVEHYGTEPWSTGKVGMTGGSYLGITQYLAAEQQPPHLAAITPIVALSDLYRDAYTHGGIINLNFDLQYIAVQGAPGAAGPNSDPSLLQATLAAKLGQSPPGTIAFDYLARPDDDPFYADRSPITHVDRITVPVLDLGSWHDGLLRGEPEMYQALARRRDVETRLYMDPCTHKGCGAPFAPLTDPPGRDDSGALIFEFLSHYLLGTPMPDRPRVRVYLQHADRYIDADRWPPAGVTPMKLGLGAGTLRLPDDRSPAPARDATASYVTDPAAGFSMAFDQYGTVAGSPYVPTDQRLEGPQGLTFRTRPLTEPLRLVGPTALHLSAASTASDTDWYAKLADVAPDGSESIITAGALRASHRALDAAKSTELRPYHTHVDPQPIVPGRFTDYAIEIWPTAYEIAPGHQLQLRLTSSDLPTHLPGTVRLDLAHPDLTRIDLNPPATNTVRLADSALLVPVLGTGAAAGAGTRGMAPRACVPRRTTRMTMRRLPPGARLLRVRATVDGHRTTTRRHGRRLTVRLPAARRGTRAVVRVRVTYRRGHRVATRTETRRVNRCRA